jgi:hypothetical protein
MAALAFGGEFRSTLDMAILCTIASILPLASTLFPYCGRLEAAKVA